MKLDDTQIGTPQILYKGAKAAIEALTGVVEGAIAYATDTNKIGTYDGSAWTWGAAHIIQDEGTPLASRTYLNFVGAGVTVTDDAGNDQTDITISAGGGSGHTIQDEGTPLAARSNLNFVGTGVTVTDDAGNDQTDVTIPMPSASDIGALANPVNHIEFDLTPTAVPDQQGILSWNSTDLTLDLNQGNATQQIGQEQYIRCVNKTGSPIANASLVYISGSQGNRPTIALARGDVESTSHVIGMCTEAIANNDEGFVTTFGYVRKIDTTGGAEAWVEGDHLYVSKTVAGAATKVEPDKPHHSDQIGIVTNVHANQGSILISISRHVAEEELSSQKEYANMFMLMGA